MLYASNQHTTFQTFAKGLFGKQKGQHVQPISGKVQQVTMFLTCNISTTHRVLRDSQSITHDIVHSVIPNSNVHKLAATLHLGSQEVSSLRIESPIIIPILDTNVFGSHMVQKLLQIRFARASQEMYKPWEQLLP